MNSFLAFLTAVSACALLAGCSGVSSVTKERVAHSETVVQQAEQTIGKSEAGATDLQTAKERLASATRAVAQDDSKAAERFASQAQLAAELAIARSQSAQARTAAAELTASTETLRQEAARGSNTSR